MKGNSILPGWSGAGSWMAQRARVQQNTTDEND